MILSFIILLQSEEISISPVLENDRSKETEVGTIKFIKISIATCSNNGVYMVSF